MKVLAVTRTAVVTSHRERFKALSKFGDIELTVVTPEAWVEGYRKIHTVKNPEDEYKLITLPTSSWGLPWGTMKNVTYIYRGMDKVIEEVKPDVFDILEEPYSLIAAHTLYLKEKLCRGAKCIFYSAQNIKKTYPLPFRLTEKYVFNRADFSFPVSLEVSNVLSQKGFSKDMEVIPWGIDPVVFKRLQVSKLKEELKLKRFTIGFIGRLVNEKGIIDLMRAAAGMENDISLLIVGRGPLEKKIMRLARRFNMNGRVIIRRGCEREEVPQYLSAMDLLVVPSLSTRHWKEQFGRIIIEAWGCLVPVIGSSSGHIPELIDQAGLIFEEGDVLELRHRIRQVKKNIRLRLQLIERGKIRLKNNYTWEKVAEKIYNVYKRL
jgi:glycosyltransferase involved in cell wall biosynthesis